MRAVSIGVDWTQHRQPQPAASADSAAAADAATALAQARQTMWDAVRLIRSVFSSGEAQQAQAVSQLKLGLRSQVKTVDVPEFSSLAESEQSYLSELALREKALGFDHPELLTTLLALLELYRVFTQDQPEATMTRSKPIMERCLRMVEAHPEWNPKWALEVFSGVAAFQYTHGAYEVTCDLYGKAIATAQKMNDELTEAALLQKLGNTERVRGRFDHAKPAIERSLEIRMRAKGPTDVLVAASLGAFAKLLVSMGKYAEAEGYFKRAIAIEEKEYGAQHPTLAESLHQLAQLNRRQGKFADAAETFQRALAAKVASLGEDHPNTALTVMNLAVLYRHQARYDLAEPLYKRAIDIYKRTVGTEHVETAETTNSLAVMLFEQRRFAEAEPLFLEALHVRTALLGPKHNNVAETHGNMGRLYLAQGRIEEAEKSFLIAVQTFLESSGAAHPDYARSLHFYGEFLTKVHRYPEAEDHLRRALAIRDQVLGRINRNTGATLYRLGLVVQLTGGRAPEAESLLKEALHVRVSSLPEGHPEVMETIQSLCEFYRAENSPQAALAMAERYNTMVKTVQLPVPPTAESLATIQAVEAWARSAGASSATLTSS